MQYIWKLYLSFNVEILLIFVMNQIIEEGGKTHWKLISFSSPYPLLPRIQDNVSL